jgi:transcriptional regulator with XRE-family HTH domain
MRAHRAPEVFGQVLREVRTQRGLSQERLALESKVDRTFVSQIERGVRQPSLTTMFRLADALNVSPSALLVRVERVLERRRLS